MGEKRIATQITYIGYDYFRVSEPHMITKGIIFPFYLHYNGYCTFFFNHSPKIRDNIVVCVEDFSTSLSCSTKNRHSYECADLNILYLYENPCCIRNRRVRPLNWYRTHVV